MGRLRRQTRRMSYGAVNLRIAISHKGTKYIAFTTRTPMFSNALTADEGERS